MFGHRPEKMLTNPAARWRTRAGLGAELQGHPAPDYVSRRSAVGVGPGYGEGFGGPIGGDRVGGELAVTRPQRRGIVDRYHGGFRDHQPGRWR